jgi:hypothetical protein
MRIYPSIRLLLLVYAPFILFSCGGDQTRDIRDYYFPVRELTDGLVYEYRDLNYDSLTPDYWYFNSIPTDSAFYFTKAYYQNDFVPRQLYREEMVSNGILLQDLFLFESDSTNHQIQVKADILSPNSFPFEVADAHTVYLYKVRFQLPSQVNGQTTVIINRRFQGDTTYTYQGTTYPAVSFSLQGIAEQRDSVLGDIEPRFSGHEIYAKGLGLVYYERSYGPDAPGFHHQLVDRYPMSELAEQAKGRWE